MQGMGLVQAVNDEQLDVGDQEKLKGVHDVEGSKQRQRALGDDKLAVELVLIQGKGGNVAGCGDVGEAEHEQDVTKNTGGKCAGCYKKTQGEGQGGTCRTATRPRPGWSRTRTCK